MIATGAIASQARGRDLFSFFRTPLPDFLSGNPADAPPIDPDSVRIMARMKWEMPRLMDGTVPGRSAVWGPKLSPRAPLYKVGPGASAPALPSDQDDSDYARTLLSNQGVPIPSGAVVAQPGDRNDRNMSVWSPAEDKIWEGTGLKHHVEDMQFWAPSIANGLATTAPTSGGTLTVGKAYFYRVSAVTDEGETGVSTPVPSWRNAGNIKVALVVPTGGTTPLRTATLRLRPRYLINAINVYRCEATNGPTLPDPTTPPPAGQEFAFHRLTSDSDNIYRSNGTTWGSLAFSGVKYPFGTTTADYKLVDTILPTGPNANPNLFAINGVLGSWTDSGRVVTNPAKVIPLIGTTDTAWRCFRMATILNVSACPGYSRDLSSGPQAPQGRFWFGSATRISLGAGVITKRDWDRNEIDHVMTWIFNVGPGGNSSTPPSGWWHDPVRFAFPAQSCDGNRGDPVMTSQMQAAGCPSTALPIPEGARFRLPANFDLTTITQSAAYIALTATQKKLCMMVATALKHYGIITTDGGAGVNIHCGWPCTEDPTDPAIATYGSPASPPGPDAEYDGRSGTTWRPGWTVELPAFKPRKTSTGAVWDGPFPWDAMEVVRMGWGPDYQGAASDLSPCTNNAIACPLGGQ